LSSSNSTTFTNYSSSTADSIDGLSLGIGTELARVYQTTASLNVQTGSQNSLNTSLGLITSSIYSEITSFNSVFQRIGSTTSSMNTQSGSQDLVNLGISSVTGSLIGITNTLMAFTAALDNTYATDAQLYQLYQATASIQFTTRSLNLQTSSQDLVNLTISTYTGSQNVINSSVDSHILKQATQTGSQDLVNLGISTVTGSLIGITNGLMAFTAALDSTYATDAQLYQLYQATRSLELHSGSMVGVTNGLMAYTASNSTLNTGLRGEVDGIEAYTASLKGQAIVSSSQQITNYYKFAETASANTTFYGGIKATEYSNFGKSGLAKAADFQNDISVTGSITTQVPSIGGFVGSYYKQWDSFGTQGGDGVASVGYFVGAEVTDRKLSLTSDSDIQLNHGFGKKIQITRNFVSNARVELTGSLLVTGSSNIIGNLAVTLGGITGSILATNGVLSGSVQIGELTQIAGIEAYTASLKGAEIVSSSQQITNYYKFAETASANTTFYGNVTASAFNVSTFGGTTDIYHTGGGHTVIKNTTTNKDINYQTVGTGEHYFNSDVNITNGNLVFDNGKGIDFSATANSGSTTTSELLNDYEEGTFTATLKGSISDPTTPVTTTGYYTKVGNKVTIWVEFASVDTTGASGEVFVQGLPFTSSTNCKSPGGVVTFNLNFNSAEYLTAFMTSNGTSFELLGARSSSTWTVATHTASANVYLVATITYFV
jgi:hypothetical protein